MNILVTGITGFIGKNFYRLNSNSRFKIKAFAKNESINNKLFSELNYLNCNFDNFEKFSKEIIEFKPDVVLNMAWKGIPDYSEKNSIYNLNKTLSFFEFITEETDLKKFINTGTCAEYFYPKGKISEDYEIKPQDNFSKAKIDLNEKMLSESQKKGINYINLRLFYVYGLHHRKQSLIPYLINSYKNDKKPLIDTPYNKLDYIYVDDVVSAINHCILGNIPNGSYNVGSGVAYFNYQVQEIVSRMMRIKFDYRDSYPQEKKESINFFADIDKLKNYSGWQPRYDLNRGIKNILG